MKEWKRRIIFLMLTILIVSRFRAIDAAFEQEYNKSKELSDSLNSIVAYCKQSTTEVLPYELYSDAKTALKRQGAGSYYSIPWVLSLELFGLLGIAIAIEYVLLKREE